MFTSWIYVEEKTSKLCYTVTLIASCPILGPIRNGIITHVTRKSGGEVEIKCRANYTLFGSSKLSCINGEWGSSIPSCKGMSHTCDHQSRNKKRKANFHGLHLASTSYCANYTCSLPSSWKIRFSNKQFLFWLLQLPAKILAILWMGESLAMTFVTKKLCLLPVKKITC